jgi:hypothetical protein
MLITIQNAKNDQFYAIEVEDNATIEDIKTLIEVESGILMANQIVVHNGRLLNQDLKKAKECGIANNDMLLLSEGPSRIG